MPFRAARTHLRLSAWLTVLVAGFFPSIRAQSDISGAYASAWDISDLLDRLPTVKPFGKLTDDSPFPIEFYVRPHLGDFVRRDYLRLPVGVRAQLTEHVELNSELESYFTHGLRESAGYGFSRYRFGGKYEDAMTLTHPLGWSLGTDFETPLSRPPLELTDGYRHVLPYWALSQVLLPNENLVGYASLGADFLSHTELPSNFGRNQLHGNSSSLSVGLTRDWARFRVALTGTWSTTEFLSDERHQVFALRPDILIPLVRRPGPKARTHLLLILGARAVRGPDGTELGVSSSLRIEFSVRPSRPSP